MNNMVADAEKAVIRASWTGVNLEAAGAGFFIHLAEEAPDVYNEFSPGVDPHGPEVLTQGFIVMQFVNTCVQSLDDMTAVQAKLAALAFRHIGYGVKMSHFEASKPSFLVGLANALGAAFTADARAAWAVFYDVIAAGLCACLLFDSQKSAITASWAGVDLQATGTAFHVHLKLSAPEVYAVFNLGEDPRSAEAQVQGLRIMQFVDSCVNTIQDMAAVRAKVNELALRYPAYGTKKAHFPLAKSSFLDALSDGLGAKFDSEAKAAWAVFYDAIVSGLAAHFS